MNTTTTPLIRHTTKVISAKMSASCRISCRLECDSDTVPPSHSPALPLSLCLCLSGQRQARPGSEAKAERCRLSWVMPSVRPVVDVYSPYESCDPQRSEVFWAAVSTRRSSNFTPSWLGGGSYFQWVCLGAWVDSFFFTVFFPCVQLLHWLCPIIKSKCNTVPKRLKNKHALRANAAVKTTTYAAKKCHVLFQIILVSRINSP